MKKKYITFLALLLSVSLGCSAHLALALDSDPVSSPTAESTETGVSEPADATPQDNSTLQLSLEDSLKYLESGNSSLQLADRKLEILEYQYEQALSRRDVISVVDIDSQKEKTLNHLRAKWNWDNAVQERKDLLKDLKVQITDQYQNILASQQQADNYTKQIANLDKTIEEVKLEIELGLKIPATIYAYDAQRSSLEAGQKSLQNDINSSLIALKQDLGIDLQRDVVLTSGLTPYTKFDDTDFNGKIAAAIQDNYDFIKYQQDIEVTEVEYSIDKRYNDGETDQVELSIEDKKGTLSTLPTSLEAGFRSSYNSLKSLESLIKANELTLEADQINIDILQKSIDVGKSSSLEMISLENTLLDDQLTLQKNIISYMTAAANLRNDLNLNK